MSYTKVQRPNWNQVVKVKGDLGRNKCQKTNTNRQLAAVSIARDNSLARNRNKAKEK